MMKIRGREGRGREDGDRVCSKLDLRRLAHMKCREGEGREHYASLKGKHRVDRPCLSRDGVLGEKEMHMRSCIVGEGMKGGGKEGEMRFYFKLMHMVQAKDKVGSDQLFRVNMTPFHLMIAYLMYTRGFPGRNWQGICIHGRGKRHQGGNAQERFAQSPVVCISPTRRDFHYTGKGVSMSGPKVPLQLKDHTKGILSVYSLPSPLPSSHLSSLHDPFTVRRFSI